MPSRPARRGKSQQALLAGGILSSLLYAATDLAGGLLYDGYSFTAQAWIDLKSPLPPWARHRGRRIMSGQPATRYGAAMTLATELEMRPL
jgi:hypothetical protein